MNTSQNIHWNRQLVRKEPYSELYSDIQNLSCHSTDITLGLTLLSWPTEMKDLIKLKQNSLVCLYSVRVLENQHGTHVEHGMGMRPRLVQNMVWE